MINIQKQIDYWISGAEDVILITVLHYLIKLR